MRTSRVGLLWAVIAAVGATASSAKAQCDEVRSVEGVTALDGTDGRVRAMVMWDPDGTGPQPNLLAVAGRFNQAGGVSTLGMAGWDGANFRDLSGAGMAFYPTHVLTWDRDESGPLENQLVSIVGYPHEGPTDSYLSYRGSGGWQGFTTFFGGTISAATTWDPDGSGPMPTNLVIAGDNLQIGSVSAHVMRFDGTNWYPVANVQTSNTFLGQTIKALTVWDPDGAGSQRPALVVGGRFSEINDVGANNVAYLTFTGLGYTVNNIAGGVNSRVDALYAWDAGGAVKRLVIAGNFTTAGGGSGAAGLVFWTGGPNYFGFGLTNVPGVTQMCEWDPDGNGPIGRRLVVNGAPNASDYGAFWFNTSNNQFTRIGAVLAPNTGSIENIPALGVWDILGWGGTQPQYLFAAGQFSRSVDMTTGFLKGFNNIARIGTGEQWIPVPNVDLNIGDNPADGVNAVVSVSNMTTTNPSGTFAGGKFDFAGDEPARNFAVWNGTTWQSVAGGVDGPVNAIATFRAGGPLSATSVYVGGEFVASGGGTTLNRIARLTGGPLGGYSWTALGTGLNGAVHAMLQFDPDGSGPTATSMIVAGAFTTANGVTANRIAVYTPATGAWSTLGTGFNNTVWALASWDPDGSGPQTAKLVAGGAFTTASGITANRLAVWDGIQWQPFEGGGITGNLVMSLMVWPDPAAPTQPRLVVGGLFSQAGGTTANSVAVWRTGSGWNTSMGLGVLGNTPLVKVIAAIDLDGVNSPTTATDGTELIIGGRFNTNGQGEAAANLARWNPITQRWTAMGSFSGFPGAGTVVRVVRLFSQAAGDRPNVLIGGNFYRYDNNLPLPKYHRGLAVWKGKDPYIASAPAAQDTVCAGESTTLTTTVLGDSLVYRWQRNGVNLFNGPTGNGSSLSGVTSATLTIDNVSPGDAGTYTCNIFSTCANTSTKPAVLDVVVCCGSSDYNCDGDFGTDADIEAFFACLAGACPGAPCTSSSDFNGDGDFGTDADIEAFFRVLAGGNC